MKKVVLLSLIALALCAFPMNMRAENVCHAIAGEVTTDDGADHSRNGSFSFQMIVTQQELVAAGVQPGYISGITFNWLLLQTGDKSKQLSIYLASTSKSSFAGGSDYVQASAFPATPHYTVDFRRYPHILKNGENNYTFNTPFEWDGNSNIVVAVIANYALQTGKNSTGFTALGGIYNVSRYLYSYANNSQYSVGVFSTASRSNFRPAVSFCQNNCLPANLAVSGLTTNSAIVEWDDCAGCTNGFDVVCSESQITDFSAVTPQHVTDNYIRLTSLDEYTDYYVYVRSCCGIYSAWSKALHFKTLLNCTAPENVNITDVQKHRITLNWTPKTSISSYDIILSTTALTDPSSAPITYANVTGSSKVLSNLQRETTYYIYIRANCDDLYYSEWVGGVSATTRQLECENPTDRILSAGSNMSPYLPVNGGNCNRPQTMQSIYPESMLSGLVRKEITNLKYFVEDDGGLGKVHNWDNVQFNIRMMTTDQTTFSGGIIPTTDATLVYSGALNANETDDMVIELTTPFSYNGGNLLIEFETSGRDGDLSPNSCWFYGVQTQNSVSYCIFDQGTGTLQYSENFLPKLQLNYCDYLLCPALESAPVASDITSNSATITWNAGSQGNASSYDMIVSLNPISDFTNVTPTYSGRTTTSRNITGLNTNTQYYVYVRANCTNGDESDGSSLWSLVCQFRTLKNITGITSFSIDNNITVVGNVNIDDEHHNISAIVAEETNLTTIPFMFTLADNTCSIAKVDGSSFQSPYDFTNPVTVRVYAEDRTVYEDWEITIIEVPCPAPKNFTVGQITSSTAQLSWTQNGSIRTWRIYGAQGNAFEVNSSNCTVNGNQYSYTLTYLSPKTDYTLQLQGICGEVESSNLYAAEQPQFHTLNNAIGINSFEITNTDLQVVGVNIDNTTHTIKAVLAEGTDLTNKQIQFELTLADDCTVTESDGTTPFESPQNFVAGSPVNIRVYAEDRNITPQQWTILVVVGTCVSPTNLSVTGIAAREATLNWSVSDLSATSFDLVVSKEQLDDPSTGTVQDINGTRTHRLSPLTPDTHYYIYIRTDCGTETSRWSSVEFNTPSVYECTATDPVVVAGGANDTTQFPVNSVKFNAYQKTQSIYPESMLMGLRGKKITELKYFVTPSSALYSGNSGIFNIKIRTTNQSVLSSRFVDTTIPDSATTVYTGKLSTNTSKNMVINFTTPFEYTGGNLLIEFANDEKGTNQKSDCNFFGVWLTGAGNVSRYDYDGNIWELTFLPKVEFTACKEVEVVVCPAITAAPAASEVKHNSATITWTAGTGEHLSSYDMIVSETAITDFTNAAPTHPNINTESYSLTSLTPNTDYYVYVRVNCVKDNYDDGSSQWSPVCSFRTLNNVTGITSFKITNATVLDDVTINSETHNISAKVLDDADLNSLAFTYTLADATCTAKVGGAVFSSPWDFTNQVSVRVYAEDTEVFEDWKITIEKEPCPAPKNFGFVDQNPITSSTAPLSWDQKGTGISWKIHVTSGDNKIEVSVSDGGVPKDRKLYILSNLTPNTNYTLQLQASGDKCPDGPFAAERLSFRTLNNATDITSFALLDENIRLMEGITINSTDHTITATVHKGTDLTSVPFTIGLAEGCTAKVNGQPLPSSSSLDFRSTVTVRVHAEDVALYQDWNIKITEEACATPYDVRLTDIQKYQMTLEWSNQGVGESDSYDIAVSETELADPSTAPVTYSGVPGNSKVLYLLDRNTTYYVYLRNNCGGNLTTWVSATATTLDIQNPECPCPAVSAPQAENITSSSATITWDAGTGDFATTYDIVYSDAPINDFAGVSHTASNLTNRSYTLTSLDANKLYNAYVRVNCVNDPYNDGSSQWSPAGVFRTLNNVTDIASFSFNGDVEVGSVTIDNNAHTINATVSFETDLTNLPFTLTLADSRGAVTKDNGDPLPSSLDFSNQVTVVVYAEDRNISQEWTITIEKNQCLAPNNFRTEQIASSSVQLSWIQNGTVVNAWKIHVTPGDGVVDVNVSDCQIADNQVSYTLTGLTPNTNYTLRLQGIGGECSDNLYADKLSFRTRNNVVGVNSFALGSTVRVMENVAIDQNTKRITATVHKGTDLTNVPFTIGLAEGCTAEVNGKPFTSSWDFSSSVIVRVHAEDVAIYEDWTIEINKEACATPYSVGLINIGKYQMTLRWYNSGNDPSDSYDIVVSKTALDDPSTPSTPSTPTVTYSGVPGNSKVLDLLDRNTKYYVYLRNNCGGNNVTEWVSATATTLNIPNPDCPCPAVSAPQAENITSSSATITWDAGAGDFATTYDLVYSDDWINDFSGVTPTASNLTNRSYTLTSLDADKWYFAYVRVNCVNDRYNDGSSQWSPAGVFRTLNNVTDIASFTLNDDVVVGTVNIDKYNHTISAIVAEEADLSNLAFTLTLADDKGIATVGEQGFIGSWDFTDPVTVVVYAEDRNISQEWTISIVNETCTTPYNLSVTNIAERTATLNWNVKDNTATSFDIVVSKESLDPSTIASWQNITTTNNAGVCMYNISGPLTPDAHYYVYIRTDCGNNEVSRWSSVEFNTMSVLDCNNMQSVVVADGTSGLFDRCKFPIMGHYCDRTQKTQSIYPASMLKNLMGNRISKLKYFVEQLNYGGLGNIEFNIKMKSTDQSTLSDFIATTDATLVYSGPLTPNDQNMEIALTKSFDYTGGNLLIEFELTETGNQTYCYFRGIEDDGNVSRAQMWDGDYFWSPELSTFLPQVEFTTCEKVSACPEVTNVAATNVDERSATITWTASTGKYANTSDIYYSTTEVEDFTGIVPQFTDISGNPQQITGLAQNTTYYVYVRTHCDAQGYDDGVSGWVGTSFLTLAPCRIPGSLTPTVTGKHTATVTWTNTSGGSQADNFTYILSTTPIAEADLETASATAKVSAYNNTTVNLSSLLSETTYYFYVKNVCTDAVNCSSPWVSCQFTMPAEMPAVINLQAHDIAHNAFTVTWESDLANFANETEWEVACVPAGGIPESWTQVSVPEYFALGLTAETTYDFYVRAMSGDSHSANAMIEVTTIVKGAAYGCKEITVRENYNVSDVPVYSCYMGSYTVQIYTADDLRKVGCNGAGTIEKIAFFQTYCSDSDYDYASCYRKNTTVWIGNTTKGSFDNKQDWIHGLTKVMNEKPIDFNKNGDWVELQLDEPFYWDGESNLAVAVLAYSDDYTNMYFAGGYVESNRSICSYTDMNSWSVNDGVPSYAYNVYTTTQLANIRLCFEHASCRSVDKLKVDNITNTSARAHWYPGDNETAWHVYNSTTEMTNDALDALTSTDYSEVTDNPEISLNNLIKDMDYYLYVRASCSADEVSHWRYYKYSTLPTCSAPVEAIATTDNNSITFTVNHGEYGYEGTYDYRYWIAGSNDIVTESGKTSQFTVSGLSGDKDYEWEVRANCSGTGEGSSRWVKGNAVHLCGTVTLPWYSNFDQCDEGSVPDCWTVIEGGDDEDYVEIEDWDQSALAFYGTSSVATPRLNFPAGDYDITIDLYIYYRVGGQMKVMFATDLSDETTYTTIHTIDLSLYENFNATLPLHIDAVTTGYIVLSQTGSGYLYSGLYSLNVVGSAVVDDGCSEFVAGYEGSICGGPIYGETNKASYSVQIYPADELIAQGYQAGDISSIAFYQTYIGYPNRNDSYLTTVWMGNTTKESFANDNDWITGLTKVMDKKSVNFNKNGDWVDLPLDNGKTFYWDGESNIAVAVLANPEGDEYNDCYFRGGYGVDDVYRSLYVYDYSNEMTVTDGVPSMGYIGSSTSYANIKLCYAAGTCPVVTGIKVDNITTTSATARWTAGENVSIWHVYNSPTRLTNAELAALEQSQQYSVVNTNPEISFNNLIKDTDYYLYVRASCSADEVSHWRYYKYSTLPTCSAPVEAIATTDNNSITFTVNHGDEGTYDYRYWIAGSNDIVTESGKTSQFTVSGLSGDKDYEWEVRANCSGTGEGSSRWVKGNTIHVCGVLTLPYFNDFEQYDDYSVPDCWQVLESYTLTYNYSITFPFVYVNYDYDYGTETMALDISNNSSIATPLISVPAEGLRISLDFSGDKNAKIKVMFTTDLTADESTYTPIGTLDCGWYEEFFHKTLQFTPDQATTGYIVFSHMSWTPGETDDFNEVYLDNLLIEAIPTNDTKDVTVDKVTYTISGLLQGNDVTIEKVTFNENDLTEADFDITCDFSKQYEFELGDFINYKHKLDIPATLTDVIKDRYRVAYIKADAFDDITLTNKVRVNIPYGVTFVIEGDMPKYENIVMKLLSNFDIIYNGENYVASNAYKVNLCDGATLEQRPFIDSRNLQIRYTDGDGKERKIDNTNVFKTEGEMQFKYEEGAWRNVNRESESGMFEATLLGDEVTIDVGRSNTIRVAEDAQYNGTFDLTFCNELKFQTDNVNRSYPDCQLTGNMPLGDETKVKAEMKFNNKEYYYFSLPFNCNVSDIQVMAGTDVVERSNSIDEAINSEDLATHHYVLFKWNESAYTSDETTGYVELEADVTMLEKNKGYVIAIVESAGWYNTYWNVDGASLDVTATFTAGDDYKQVASSESEIEIPVTRADAVNAYSGWNLVGNPFYGSVKSSQYSYNKYVRKVVRDNGIKPEIGDYASEIPVFNEPIRPFETVFIQKSDAAGDGTVTVIGSPVQKVQGAPAILPEYVTITLNDSSRMIDRTTIINDVLSSDGFLQQEDLLKSHQGSNEIYTQYGDFDFSFNEMNITDADKTIPLAVKVAAEGDYTIAMSSELSNYPAGDVFLHDKTLETYMKLSDGEVETLHLTEGVTEGRLEIVIKVDEVIVEPDNTEDVSEGGIAVYVHDGIATIEGIEVGAMVTIVDATGKTLYMSEATGNRMDYQFAVRGVYMITVRNNANVNTMKVVY